MSKFDILTFEDYMDRLISIRLSIRDADEILLSKLFIFRRIMLQFGFGTVINLPSNIMTNLLGYVDDNYTSLVDLKTDEELISVFLFDNTDFDYCKCCHDVVYTKTSILCLDCESNKQQAKYIYNVITSHWDNQ